MIPSVALEDGKWVARASFRPWQPLVLSAAGATKNQAIDRLKALVEQFDGTGR